MKNEKLYKEYAIEGWPCHFYTTEAMDKYNARIERYCKRLPEGATELTRWQEISRQMYVKYLDFVDGFAAFHEMREAERASRRKEG